MEIQFYITDNSQFPRLTNIFEEVLEGQPCRTETHNNGFRKNAAHIIYTVPNDTAEFYFDTPKFCKFSDKSRAGSVGKIIGVSYKDTWASALAHSHKISGDWAYAIVVFDDAPNKLFMDRYKFKVIEESYIPTNPKANYKFTRAPKSAVVKPTSFPDKYNQDVVVGDWVVGTITKIPYFGQVTKINKAGVSIKTIVKNTVHPVMGSHKLIKISDHPTYMVPKILLLNS